MSTLASVAVCAISTRLDRIEAAAPLAARLALPLVSADDRTHEVLLTVTDDRLEARQTDSRAGAVAVEFTSGSFGYRRRPGSPREAVVRAVGFKTQPLEVFDMTAGLGRDAMVLALAGCRVTTCERSPIVHALLEDGLRRASLDEELTSVLERLTLIQSDAIEALHRTPRPDVVYLDPMFPERTGSAVPSKELRLLARIVGASEDAGALLDAAVASGAPRIVVKRPRLAPTLSTARAATPGMRLEGRSSRFDVYFPTNV